MYHFERVSYRSSDAHRSMWHPASKDSIQEYEIRRILKLLEAGTSEVMAMLSMYEYLLKEEEEEEEEENDDDDDDDGERTLVKFREFKMNPKELFENHVLILFLKKDIPSMPT